MAEQLLLEDGTGKLWTIRRLRGKLETAGGIVQGGLRAIVRG